MSACASRYDSSGFGEKVDSGTVTAPASAGAEQGRHRLGPVPHEHADPGALPDAHRQQRLGDAPGVALQVRVCPPHGGAAEERVVEDERLVVREPRALFEEQAPRVRAPMPDGVVQGGPVSVSGSVTAGTVPQP